MKPSRAQANQLAQRDRIVMQHLPLVKSIALRIRETLPVHIELDDVVHAGALGLIDAAAKYDPDKEVEFASYAKHRIRGAILDSLRQEDPVSRDLRKQARQADVVVRELSLKLQRVPTEAEVAATLSIDLESYRALRLKLQNAQTISASPRPNAEQDEAPQPEFASAADTHPDVMVAQEQMKTMLGRALQVLSPRYQKVVTLYYTGQMTMKEIGSAMGINESRVSQIHKSALEKMGVALQECGISSARAFCQ